MTLGQWSILVTLMLSYQFAIHDRRRGTVLVVTLPIVQRFSLQKRKLSELWLVHNVEPNAEI
jgi:hypothetical protein